MDRPDGDDPRHAAEQHGAEQHGAEQHGAEQHGAEQHGAVERRTRRNGRTGTSPEARRRAGS